MLYAGSGYMLQNSVNIEAGQKIVDALSEQLIDHLFAVEFNVSYMGSDIFIFWTNKRLFSPAMM